MLNEEGDTELSVQWSQKIIDEARLQKFNLLDIGCGLGSYLYEVSRIYPSINIFGTETDNDKFLHIQKIFGANRDNFYLGNPADHFLGESFEIITMFDVIEHISNPTQFLQNEVFPLLKPGGLFIFQTPNKPINMIKETIEWRSFSKWRVEHCSLQTRSSLTKLIHESGFVNLRLSKFRFDSEFKKNKLEKLFPKIPTAFALKAINRLPSVVYPNIWGVAQKF